MYLRHFCCFTSFRHSFMRTPKLRPVSPMRVVRTLLDRFSKVVSEEQDRVTEEVHIQKTLSRCGCPEWTIRKVRSELGSKTYRKATAQVSTRPQGICDHPICRRCVGSSSKNIQQIWSLYGHETSYHHQESVGPEVNTVFTGYLPRLMPCNSVGMRPRTDTQTHRCG